MIARLHYLLHLLSVDLYLLGLRLRDWWSV